MIKILHRETGEVLKQLDSESLVGANFRDVKLSYANLSGADLSGAILTGADLSGADLSGANLSGADLRYAGLISADLRYADLSRTSLISASLNDADLTGADLISANLISANLAGADLKGANLTGANLTGAYLRYANLTGANLNGADLADATIEDTIFAACRNLQMALGLEEVRHFSASVLDVRTLRESVDKLPRTFLKGVGYKDEEIDALIELYTTNVIEFYSCFIAHSKEDDKFVNRLYTDLQAKNVTCFHYRFDMRGGEYWREQINRAIKKHDKLLVVCSKEALLSENVVEEIITAIEEEERNGIQKLFPIRLDNYVLESEIAEISRRNSWSQKWRMDWVPRLRAYQVCDFRKWKNHDAYEKEFQRLVEDIQAPKSSVVTTSA